MNAIKIAGLLLTLLIAGGCGRIASPGDLLHAPNLANEEQSLYRAVQPFLPAGYQLTTPDLSDQGSAIRLADLDGDGEQELIVSYKKPDTDYEVNVLILTRQEGSWRKADLITDSGVNLDYLGIRTLKGDSSAELLLGYDGGGTGLPKELSVYSFSNGKAASIFHQSYDQIAVGDLLGSGAEQIAIVPPAASTEDTRSKIQLFGVKNGKLALLTERRTDGSVLNMQIERASEKRSGLFAQILSTSRSGYTVLLAWENGRLANMLSLPQKAYDKRTSRQDIRLGAPDYSQDLASTEQKWWIDYPAENRDIDGDGILEIALPNPVTNAEGSSGTPKLWSDSYYRWDGGRRMTFVEDRFWQWGYDLRIPDRWLGKYRVELLSDSEIPEEVRFVYAAGAGTENERLAPLLTLRQLSAEEWSKLLPALEGSGNEYVLLGGAGPVVPGSPPEVTVAFLPGASPDLAGKELENYEELRLTKAEVVRLAGVSAEDGEEADSDVEGY